MATGTDRRAWLALGVLVALMLVSLAWLVHPWYEPSDETHDAAIYVACAKSIVNGEGYAYLGQPFKIRPPGMSLLIAPLIAWRGLDFHALNMLVSLFGVACSALVFAFARARVGTVLALALAIVVWLNDGFRALCNQAMSDVPGAAAIVGCLVIERWVARKPSWRRDAVLGAAIGLSAYLRSIAIVLVAAILVSRLLARGGEPWKRFFAARVAPMLVASIVIVLPWEVRNALVQSPPPPADQNFLYSYSTAMWRRDGGDPSSPRRSFGEIAARVPERTGQVLDTLGTRMRGGDGALAESIGALLLACTLIIAWRRREPAELFVLATVAVLLVYFGFRARLVLPIWILSLVAAAECALIVLRRPLGERAACIVAAILCAVMPAFDFRPHRDWDRIESTDAAWRKQAIAIAARLAPSDRVATTIGWHEAVYLDRPVYSLFFAARRDGIDAIENVLAKYRIDAVALWPALPADRGLVPWFEQHHGPGEVAGDARIFRVHAR